MARLREARIARGFIFEVIPAVSRSLWAGSAPESLIRVRRCAPEIESVARAMRGLRLALLRRGTDDSVHGVVELQSVHGAGELRCAGGFEPDRRELFLTGGLGWCGLRSFQTSVESRIR
jgi:hypothetical protein